MQDSNNNSCHQRDEFLASRSNHTMMVEETVDLKPWPKPQLQKVACAQCSSFDTRFCYYNNKSMAQPRYFCKSCRRYWTDGGSLRNVPVGSGIRKHKHSSATVTFNTSKLLSDVSGVSPSTSTNFNHGLPMFTTTCFPGNNLSLGFGLTSPLYNLVVPSVPPSGRLCKDILRRELLCGKLENSNNNDYKGMAMELPTTFGIGGFLNSGGLGVNDHLIVCESSTQEFINPNVGNVTMGAEETGGDDIKAMMMELQGSPQLAAGPVGCPQQETSTMNTMVMGANSNNFNNGECYWNNGVLSSSNNTTITADPWRALIKDFSDWEEKNI